MRKSAASPPRNAPAAVTVANLIAVEANLPANRDKLSIPIEAVVGADSD
jgi:hypothetical protein